MTTNITVKINGKEYQTYLDKHGTQRFVENRIVSRFIDSNVALYSKMGWKWMEDNNVYTLNDLSMEYHGKGEFSLDEMIEFHTMIGYSVGGFAELSYFEDVEIENPLWD